MIHYRYCLATSGVQCLHFCAFTITVATVSVDDTMSGSLEYLISS